MHPITIVPLGPGSSGLLTLGALNHLLSSAQIVVRTAQHAALSLLDERGISYQSLDHLYENSQDFDDFNHQVAQQLLQLAQDAPLSYAVADPASDQSVQALLALSPQQVQVLPGVPLSAPLLASGLVAGWLRGPVLLSPATGLVVHNAQQPLCLTEIFSRNLAGQAKLLLLPKYGESAQVFFLPPKKDKQQKGRLIPLVDLDRQPGYDHSCAALVLPQALLQKQQFDPEDLLAIMYRLRAPDGCPWDKEQTHHSLVKHLLEEANEAAAALLDEDWDQAAEELGDVFLQLAFHAVVGESHGTFTWGDMLQAVCSKLIRRHPHIFGELKLETADQVVKTWEEVKQQERAARQQSAGHAEQMLQVPSSFPSLLRAYKVQQLAAKVGFDWDSAKEALTKVPEEAAELQEALEQGEQPLEELGDLLFSCVNVARLLKVSPDEALHFATKKFIRRFKQLENAVISDKKALNLLTINEIGVYWERSKANDDA